MESTQIVHRGLVKEALHAGVSKVPTVRRPITFSGESVIPANDKVPEHTQSVLERNLGVAKEEFDELRKAGVIGAVVNATNPR
jgi:crotonobetainyl-CoA:carnitine CoA-transferase CaiB-like acyl-CoA transferase